MHRNYFSKGPYLLPYNRKFFQNKKRPGTLLMLTILKQWGGKVLERMGQGLGTGSTLVQGLRVLPSLKGEG